VIFTNRNRFGIQLLDEASFLLASPQGLELVLEGIRDGRKHNAALWVLSQHPNDMIDDRLADLIGIKLVFRQSRGAASAALRFLEMDDTDAETLELVTAGLATGSCLMRDVHGRIGMVQVMDAPTEELREAFSTRPSESAGGGRPRRPGRAPSTTVTQAPASVPVPTMPERPQVAAPPARSAPSRARTEETAPRIADTAPRIAPPARPAAPERSTARAVGGAAALPRPSGGPRKTVRRGREAS
jgi:hypothetical protein